MLPPPSDALHGKLGSLMIDPDIDEATVVGQVIDAIRNSFPISNGEVIIHIHGRHLPLGLPFLPVVLEISNQFLLLTIDGNHWLTFGFEGLTATVDVLKLGVPVGMRSPLNRLLIGLEAKTPSPVTGLGWPSPQSDGPD